VTVWTIFIWFMCAGSCEYCNQPLSYINAEEFDWMSDYQLLKKDSFSRSWIINTS